MLTVTPPRRAVRIPSPSRHSQHSIKAIGLTSFLSILVFFAAALPVRADDNVAPQAGMLRWPTVSATHIAFVYANDIWTVPREGGLASPLASPPGPEVAPRFSPDGRTIAFVGNYDGRRDIYTIPSIGGVPFRVTYHPGSVFITGWTPDDRIIYTSNFESGQRRASQIYTVAPTGGQPQRLPVPYGDAGAVSPDGQWLAYTPYNRDFRTWKRYRGGLASDIWLFNLNDFSSRQLTDWEGTDTIPMWRGSIVYYLTDAGPEHRLNIWSINTDTNERRQITFFEEWDVKWPSIGPGPTGEGEIVFQNGASLYLLDLRTNRARNIVVQVPGDRPRLMPQRINAAQHIQGWHIAPSANRAVVQARGDIWTLPAEHGSPRALTRTSGIAERDPSWSPCGRWIAYFSDETGEYELYITQSDGRGDIRQLTSDAGPFKYNPQWSPDSKHIVFTDKTSAIYLHTIDSGETRLVDRDPWGRGGGRSGGMLRVSFTRDSNWFTYARTHDDPHRSGSAIWVYNIAKDEKTQVTSGFFNDTNPVFDREGDWLYFVTNRSISSPLYSDLDTTWIYTGTQILAALPLRADIKSPFLPKSDEQTWKKDPKKPDEKQKEDDKEDKEDKDKEDKPEDSDSDADNADDKPEDPKPDDAPKPDDPISGTWQGTANIPDMGGEIAITLTLALGADNSVTGTASATIGAFAVSGRYDPEGNVLTLSGEAPGMGSVTLELKVDGETMTGTAGAQDRFVDVTFQRTTKPGAKPEEAKPDQEKPKPEDKPDPKAVKIDFENIEARAIRVPVNNGRFGRLAVNDRNHLIFARLSSPADNTPTGIKLFDFKDDRRREQSVAAGAINYEITPDGKKLLVIRGSSASIQNAAAGASGKAVPTAGMHVNVDMRAEWRQLVIDAWRIQRDFFYVANLHNVDWPKIRDHYLALVDDAASREDVSFIISEMIAELNVGHAYYWGGDVESQPTINVATLGCDFELDADNNAYRISRIITGGPWDIDARGPLSQPGVDVNVGDYLLEVNGVPVDPGTDPYAAFQGLAGRTVTITVSKKPVRDEDARDVVIEPLGDDASLRYRAWVEEKRQYVRDRTDGKVGYIHVPNTGVDGQNELVRQFQAQTHKEALIIDERWNGGGQIPTRFIELLNRPVTNYWARRDGFDWTWPPDAHHGPKCMLINGPSGSGGDMFPWLFRRNNLGPLIGTRTWGGLVGISGNPELIDGGYTAVPTFGFYTDYGRWSIEGHGVDPDYEVIDDPALMVDGSDPQLDKAIELMLEAVKANPRTRPQRPADPDRSGFGIDPDHR